jgi:AcrR family transcriptional regulator
MTDTRTSGARGTYAKTEAFRAEVLDAALRIVAEQGFDAATLQLIADQMQRSKAGLLHHFGSRERLMLEIARHRDETNRQLFRPDPEGTLSATVELVAHNATVPGLVALFAVVSALAASDPTDSERRGYFIERYARGREGFARRIAAGQEAGLLRDDIPAETAATLVIAAMDGLQIQWLLDPSIDMAEHLRNLIRLLTA